jgi:hypothetical protein
MAVRDVVVHTRAVQGIAEARFAFPSRKYPYYKAYVNQPERAMGVQMPSGHAAYPDIVVVQHPENNVKMLAQVETGDTVDEAAGQHWLTFARLGPLYLFVPVGYANEARRVCRELRVPFVGLRTWRHAVGYKEIEITEIATEWRGFDELLRRRSN